MSNRTHGVSNSLKRSKEAQELHNAFEDLQKGQKDAAERLAKFVDSGRISLEAYNELIEKYGAIKEDEKTNEARAIPKKSRALTRKTVCVLCIVVFLLLTVCAIIYHNYAITSSYNEGFEIGKTEGYDEGFLNGKKEGYKNGYNKGYSYYEEVEDEYWFFRRNARIVTKTGEKYHMFGCYHIEGRPFKIYNVETAQAKGYTFCSDCLRSIID